MGKLHQTYKLTITTLSPLHIGTGNILRLGYDFVTHKNQTWMINAETLAAVLFDQDPSEFDRMVEGVPAGDLIRPSEFNAGSSLFRYVMRGTPRSAGRGAQVQELIKDPWDRPYIPGSSLKGAIRTALAVVGWEQRRLTFQPNDLNERGGARFAALPLEHKVLNAAQLQRGKEPNYDLLRAVQISDSTSDEERHLRLLNVQVAVGNRMASPIELEAISENVTFTATLALDGFLLSGGVAQNLGWASDQIKWVKNIPAVVNHFSKPRIANEIERWRNANAPITSFYATLARHVEDLDRRTEFLLQLGWGGGWDSKTLSDVLTADQEKFYTVVKRYGTQMDRQKSFKQGDRYPKSRRVVVRGELPQAPLGWVRVKMERVE